MSNQLSLFSTPIACGIFKGTAWKSLTTLEEVRAGEIKNLWEFAVEIGIKNTDRGHLVNKAYNKTVYQYMTKPLSTQERIDLYRSKAQYNNNFKVL